jgi:transposase
MARHSGISTSSVGRIWRAFGLQPHRVETFKLSTDPRFVDKVRDIVGLYLNPLDRALVLCVDEKSQIQALDRTQPLLVPGLDPGMRPGQVERRSHDYQRHRALEFRKFLAQVEQAMPADLDIHLVLDNYATHKAPPVKAWLARHPRYHRHFTPTNASWLNQVERWFALLTDKQIKRGVHRSVDRLKANIVAFIQAHNDHPKPFIWTKTADAILQRSRDIAPILWPYMPRFLERISDSGH